MKLDQSGRQPAVKPVNQGPQNNAYGIPPPQHMGRDVPTCSQSALDAPPRPRPANDEAPTRVAPRARIIRAVEDAIHAASDGDAAEALQREFQDRLDAPDLDERLLSRPLNDIIAAICADFGLPPAPTPAKTAPAPLLPAARFCSK